jgi:hypothetical protein
LVTATTAVDPAGQLPDKPYPAGTVIEEAGTFTHNGHKYVRSQSSKEADTWYGYPIEAFSAQPAPSTTPGAVPPAPSANPVDSIQPPTPTATDPAGGVQTPAAAPNKLTSTQWLASIIAAVYGRLRFYIQLVIQGKGSAK